MNSGMLPRRFSRVCIFTAPLCVRKRAHGNIAKQSGRIQCVDRCIQVDGEFVVGVESAGFDDQHLCKLGIDAPVARFVGVGKVVARDGTVNTHVIEFRSHRPQASFDIAQALAIGQLREGHDSEVVGAFER